MIELLKQMVEALEVDAYVYNGEKSWAAIKAGKQAIAELESQEPVAYMVWGENNIPALTFTKPADKYVFDALYTHPPQRTEQEPQIAFNAEVVEYVAPQRTEQNFCSRCGKRTKDLTHIHTCTPPQD